MRYINLHFTYLLTYLLTVWTPDGQYTSSFNTRLPDRLWFDI